MHSEMVYQLSDRTSLLLLDTNLVDTIRGSGLGKINYESEHAKLQFCGMVRLSDGSTTFFLPVALQESMESPALLMSALARFGRESSKRTFEAEGDNGNCGLLSVVVRLSDDFRRYGIFTERQRVLARDTGKPDWGRTIKRERAFAKTDVFETIHTTRWIDSRETLLAQVQCFVIKEIIEIHGCWLRELKQQRGRLSNVPIPKQPRRLWSTLLRSIVPSLFSVRALRLAHWLISYLEETAKSIEGNLVFGLSDFHNVWEAMLRATTHGLERDINKRLPNAIYHRVENSSLGEVVERSMRTDIVLKDMIAGRARYTIIDAKYYAALGSSTCPGWPDIAKQMLYELALRSLVGRSPEIRNFFVFPSDGNPCNAIYKHVDMRSKEKGVRNAPLIEFPVIEIVYFSIRKVMSNYNFGNKFYFPDL